MFELVQTVFSGLTAVVFLITATIGLVQLQHLRLSYQMTSASALLQAYWTPQFQGWMHYVFFELSARLQDQGFCDELRRATPDKLRHPEIYVCEYYALIGSYMKHNLMPKGIFFANGSTDAVVAWDRLQLPIELMREAGSPTLYKDFEDLALLCRNWLAAHASTT